EDSRGPLDDWYRALKAARFCSSDDVKAAFGTASFLGDREVVFNIAGRKFRLVAIFHYAQEGTKGRVYVRHVFTHDEYDVWSDERRKRKKKR
ncbi:MAG: type II toxin-antitoxin system HigB family toxin, partial [Gemmatimonadales bacterium]